MMTLDNTCKFDDNLGSMPSSSVSSGCWCPTPGTKPRGKAGGRSRSSPVRSKKCSPEPHARSPSTVSVLRRRVPDYNNTLCHGGKDGSSTLYPEASNYNTLSHGISDCSNTLRHPQLAPKRIDDGGGWLVQANAAFFSRRPPAIPLKVVTSGVLSKFSFCKMSDTVQDVRLSSETEGEESYSYDDNKTFLIPILRRVQPTRAHISRSRTKADVGCKNLRSSRRTARRILRELIASLPLLPPDSNNVRSPRRQQNGAAHVATSAQVLITGTRQYSTCHVAVQAQSDSSEDSDEICSCNNSGATISNVVPQRRLEKDGWVGVRALRDSHVKFVLRQLKHIDQLNRALDHHLVDSAPAVSNILTTN